MSDPRNPLNIRIPTSSAEISDRIAHVGMREQVIAAVMGWEAQTRAERNQLVPPTQAAILCVMVEQLALQSARLQRALHQLQLRTTVPFVYLTTGDLSGPFAQVQVIKTLQQVPLAGGGTQLLPTWACTAWIDPADDPDGSVCQSALRAAHGAAGESLEALRRGDEAAMEGMGNLMLGAATRHLKGLGFCVAAFLGVPAGAMQQPVTTPAPDGVH